MKKPPRSNEENPVFRLGAEEGAIIFRKGGQIELFVPRGDSDPNVAETGFLIMGLVNALGDSDLMDAIAKSYADSLKDNAIEN